MGRVYMARSMPSESLEQSMWGPGGYAAVTKAAGKSQSADEIKAERDRYKEALLEITRTPFGYIKHDIAVRALDENK